MNTKASPAAWAETPTANAGTRRAPIRAGGSGGHIDRGRGAGSRPGVTPALAFPRRPSWLRVVDAPGPIDLSIIVPAYNEEKVLAASLAAVRASAAAAFDPAGLAWELVVCDNNSTDRTGEIARECGAVVVFEPFNQIGRARNTGAAAARGRWLLFIDADSAPSPGLLADAAALTRRPDVLLAGATVVFDELPPLARLFSRLWNLLSRLRRLVAGSFILVRAEAFREVGGFDMRYFAGEELDLAVRLQKQVGRRERQRTVILHRHPLVTSGRKFGLYGNAVMLRFFVRLVFRPFRTTRSREACAMWYDGRR